MATTGKDWRKAREEGVEVELPSGMTPRLRGIGFALLLHSGVVPDFLTDIIVRAAMGEPTEMPSPPDAEAALEKLEFINEIARRMFVSPRIVSAPVLPDGSLAELVDDEITINDVDDADKMFLVQMVGTPTAWLTRFHSRQAARLADILFEQGLSTAAQQVPATEAGTAP